MAICVGTESVHQILARLIEVTSSVGDTRNVRDNQAIRPVTVSIGRTVIHGILHCPQRLRTVFVLTLRTEIIMEVRFQSITSCRHNALFRIQNYFLQIVCIDTRHFIVLRVILTVGFIQIGLCQISRCSSFRRTSFVCLRIRQIVVCELEIIRNQLPSFIIRISRIRQIVIFFGRKIFIVRKYNVLIQLFQQEMSVTAQETHLGNALLF